MFSLFLLFSIFYFFYKLFKELKIKISNSSKKSIPYNKAKFYSFYKRNNILTPTELTFYKKIKQVTDAFNLNLFCQVSMYSLITCYNKIDFNRIRSKSIDFVITDKDCNIKLCIELDDYTHNYKNRKERDTFVNDLFYSVNLPLLRIPVQENYNLHKIKDLIVKELIKKSA